MGFDRRSYMKAGLAGLGSIGVVSALSTSGTAWRDIDIEAGCKETDEGDEKLLKLEVENGNFSLDDWGGYPAGKNTFGFWHFDLEITDARYEEGELREFDISTNSDIPLDISVKGGPDSENYLLAPTDSRKEVSGLHAPTKDSGNGAGEQYHAVSNVEVRWCMGLVVDVTGTSAGARPSEVIDLTSDVIRTGITYQPWRHEDQYVFDNGIEQTNGNGGLVGDGNLHFYYEWERHGSGIPFDDVLLDDPDEVGDRSNFEVEIMIESDDGSTWGGSTPLDATIY